MATDMETITINILLHDPEAESDLRYYHSNFATRGRRPQRGQFSSLHTLNFM